MTVVLHFISTGRLASTMAARDEFDRLMVFTARPYASTVYAVVVGPSVRLSHASIVSKLLNVESRKQRHT